MSLKGLSQRLRRVENQVYIPSHKYNGRYYDELTKMEQREYCSFIDTDEETLKKVYAFIDGIADPVKDFEEANLHFICNVPGGGAPDPEQIKAVENYLNEGREKATRCRTLAII